MVNDDVLLRVKEKRNILYKVASRRTNRIGHVLRGNCLLKHVTKGKIECRIKVKERRRRRRKQLPITLSKRENTGN